MGRDRNTFGPAAGLRAARRGLARGSTRPRRVRRVHKLRRVRIALLADVHGNAVAFRAALADLEDRGVDLIVSLGDVAQGGPQPVECVELLRELECPCVFGNSDEFLLTLDL